MQHGKSTECLEMWKTDINRMDKYCENPSAIKIDFISSNLYVPPHVNDVANKLIFDFLGEGKPPKIKKSTTIGKNATVGLKW